jgi:hypothetical protein
LVDTDFDGSNMAVRLSAILPRAFDASFI